jgi:hypothetical protein
MITDNEEESSVSPNVNCLEVERCPECGSWGPFEITVTMRVLLYDNGTDNAEDGSTEYGEETPTMCTACQHEATFADFDE